MWRNRTSTKNQREKISHTPFGTGQMRVIKNSRGDVQVTSEPPKVTESSVRTALGLNSRETAQMTKAEAIRLLGGN